MNIRLHIERLVLDSISLSPRDRPLMQAAMETELTGLLASGSLSVALQSSGALYNIRNSGIQLANDDSPSSLGEQIAGVYGGICK